MKYWEDTEHDHLYQPLQKNDHRKTRLKVGSKSNPTFERSKYKWYGMIFGVFSTGVELDEDYDFGAYD